MFRFDSETPNDGRGNSLQLMRCPANKPISGIITSSQFLGTRTHFYHGRTLPCDDSNCPACSEGLPWRWHSYCSLFSIATHRQILFESTAKSTEPLTQYQEAHGTLRGCHMTARRANTSPNSQVIIQTKPADLSNVKLPDEPSILEALSIIWNIELQAITVDGTNKGGPALSVHQDRTLVEQPSISNRKPLQPLNRTGNGSL